MCFILHYTYSCLRFSFKTATNEMITVYLTKVVQSNYQVLKSVGINRFLSCDYITQIHRFICFIFLSLLEITFLNYITYLCFQIKAAKQHLFKEVWFLFLMLFIQPFPPTFVITYYLIVHPLNVYFYSNNIYVHIYRYRYIHITAPFLNKWQHTCFSQLFSHYISQKSLHNSTWK